MGISLFDCISDDKDKLKVKIFDKVTRSAKNLVSVCEELERMYGIPIVNKRISITPLSYIGAGLSPEGFVELSEVLEAAAEELGVNFIGGFSAHVQKGEILGAKNLIEAIPEDEMRATFKRVAEKGAGIELNRDGMNFTEDDAHIMLKPYRIAKEMGCKFFFGSDAHNPEGLVASPPLFERAIEYLDLEDTDMIKL
jgi:uncharacterized protein (UPF0210 family)